MVVTHSQETWPSDMVSCTRFCLYKFLAPNTAQLYSIQETCMPSFWHYFTLQCSDAVV